MIITNSTADSPYFEQMLAFLQSLKINSPNDTIEVSLVNYPKDKEERLSKAFCNFTFKNRDMIMPKDKRFSLIILRAQLIKECMEKHKTSMAWIDTDVLVRKDLSEFLKVKPNQLKMLYRGVPANPGPDDSPINAGIFNIGYSEATYSFICDWLKGCIGNHKWGQGQMELWKSYKKYSDGIEFVKMDDKFNDLGGRGPFDTNSVMWHCKQNHFNDLDFRAEFDVYLRSAEEIYYGE